VVLLLGAACGGEVRATAPEGIYASEDGSYELLLRRDFRYSIRVVALGMTLEGAGEWTVQGEEVRLTPEFGYGIVEWKASRPGGKLEPVRTPMICKYEGGGIRFPLGLPKDRDGPTVLLTRKRA
jgi:hypothetical protein